MPSKYGTFTSELLKALGEATGFFSWPPMGSPEWLKKYRNPNKYVYDTLYRLKKTGFVKEVSKNGKKFFSLTSKGELEYLISKACTSQGKNLTWDGKWRIIIFDIPEEAKLKRDKLRLLLNKQGFLKLQASVFIHPHPLNREAINYLKTSGLMEYIRMARIDEMDNDNELKKKFKLL